jgi:hypothetical protein
LSKLDEILAQLDDDTAAAVKAEVLAAEVRAAKAERDLKAAKRTDLREKFPRAMAAYDKGRVSLPDDPSDEALEACLKDKEEEYADIGVPIPGETVPDVRTDPEEADPAAAFGTPVAGGAPAPKRDYVREVIEIIKSDKSTEGRAKAASILTELNREEGFMSPKLAEIVEKLNARPIVGR